jgi:hypothetical protein
MARSPDGRGILPGMNAKFIVPILDVSDFAASIAWFELWECA